MKNFRHPSCKFRLQKGISLIEMLVVLTLASLMIAGATVAYRTAVPAARLNAASAQLQTDLRNLRERSRLTAEILRLEPAQSGYVVSDIRLERDLPRGVFLDWPDHQAITFLRGIPGDAAEVAIVLGERRAVVVLEGYTGRIDLQKARTRAEPPGDK